MIFRSSLVFFLLVGGGAIIKVNSSDFFKTTNRYPIILHLLSNFHRLRFFKFRDVRQSNRVSETFDGNTDRIGILS